MAGQMLTCLLEFGVDTFLWDLQLSALDNLDSYSGFIVGALLHIFNGFDNVIAFEDFAEDDVTAIEPPAWD